MPLPINIRTEDQTGRPGQAIHGLLIINDSRRASDSFLGCRRADCLFSPLANDRSNWSDKSYFDKEITRDERAMGHCCCSEVEGMGMPMISSSGNGQ